MNIKEAVFGFCLIEVNGQTVELELLNAGLNGADNYLPQLAASVAKVSCNVLSAMLSLNNVKEGDLSISYDKDGIKKRLFYLAQQYGFDDVLDQLDKDPTISSPNVW